MSAAPSRTGALRIGELAELTGTTPRTIRYYEEIGLLPGAAERASGRHRVYDDADVARLREIVRLKELLGLTLEQLKTLVEAEDARAALRERWAHTESPGEKRPILEEALGHVTTQLDLVHERQRELTTLERQLSDKRRSILDHLATLDAPER